MAAMVANKALWKIDEISKNTVGEAMTEIYKHLGRHWTAIELLNYWISERELIRRRKEGDNEIFKIAKPWSQDPVFQETYFCSVRREDDKVTRWIRQNWTLETMGWELYDYSIVLARFINNIPCLAALLNHGPDFDDFDNLQVFLETRAGADQQVWGGAYIVTTHGIAMGKAAYLCQRVLPAAHKALVVLRYHTPLGGSSPPTLAHAHGQLMQLEGLGSFMAAQVIADLKNTEGHPLQEAEDWDEFSACGPGSLRGLKWIYGKSSPSIYEGQMNGVMVSLISENYELLKGAGRDRVNMQDLQNCLCEFDKFMRVMTRTGKSKRKYQGT